MLPHSRDLHGKGHRVSSCHLCVTSRRPRVAGQAPPSDGPRWPAGTKPGWNQHRFVLFIHRCFWGVQVPGPALGLGLPVTSGCPCPVRLVLLTHTHTHTYTLYCGEILITYFPDGAVVKNPPANTGDVSSIPGSGRSPEGGNGNPLQYSCLENPLDRGAWWATVHGVAKLDTTERLNSSNTRHVGLAGVGSGSARSGRHVCPPRGVPITTTARMASWSRRKSVQSPRPTAAPHTLMVSEALASQWVQDGLQSG